MPCENPPRRKRSGRSEVLGLRKHFLSLCLVVIAVSSLFFLAPNSGSALSASLPQDTDSMEVNPTAGTPLNRWNDSTAGDTITGAVEGFYCKLSTAAPGISTTGTRTLTRGLRSNSGTAETKVLWGETVHNETIAGGYDMGSPLFYDDFESVAVLAQKWHDEQGPGFDITPSWSGTYHHTGSYSLFDGVGAEGVAISNSSCYFTNSSNWRLEFWWYADASAPSAPGNEQIYMLPAFDDYNTNRWNLEVYLEIEEVGVGGAPTDLSEIRIRTRCANNSEIEVFDYAETDDSLFDKWVGLRIDRNETTCSVFWNLEDAGWETKAVLSGLTTYANSSCVNFGQGSVTVYYWDDVGIYPFVSDLPAGSYAFDFFVQGDNAERGGIRYSSRYGWQTYFTRSGLYTLETVPSQPALMVGKFYRLTIGYDLVNTRLSFNIYNERDVTIANRLWSYYWVFPNYPKLFEARNCTVGFRVSMETYHYASELWVDYVSAPFLESEWKTNAVSGSGLSSDPYGFTANGSATGSQYHRMRMEHFQSYSALASLDAILKNSSDQADLVLTLRYVDSDGVTGAGNNLLGFQFTVKSYSPQYHYVILHAYAPDFSITRAFSVSQKATVGYMFWREPSTNKVWLKACLWDELNNSNKVILAVASTLPTDETNIYEIWHSFSYDGNDADTVVTGTIFDISIQRSLMALPEPALPLPDQPPQPPPPYIPIISELIAVISFVLVSTFALMGAIFTPIFIIIQAFMDQISAYADAVFSDIADAIGAFLVSLLGPLHPVLDQVLIILQPFIDFVTALTNFATLFVTWLVGVIVYIITLLLDPVFWANLVIVSLWALAIYLIVPSIIELAAGLFGIGQWSLSHALIEGPVNRAMLLVDLGVLIFKALYGLWHVYFEIGKFIISLIPFIG